MSVELRLCFTAGLLAATLCAVSPAEAQSPQGSLPSRNLLSRFGLERAWSNQATINIRSDVVRYVIADEEVVIVQTRSGLLTVFDAQSGVKLWDGQLARLDQYSFPAVTNGDLLFVVIGSTVYSRDKFSGNEVWTLRLPNVPSTSPTVDDRRMYVGMLQGDVYAFDLATVATNQTEGRLPQFNYENIVWRYATSGRIVAAPVTDGKIVCFANTLGSLYAISAGERDLKFQFETGAQASAPLDMATSVEDGIDKSFIFLPAGDNHLYCLRATNGTTRWLHVAPAPIREKPHVIGNSVYLVPLDAGIYDLDIVKGKQRWWAPSVTAFIAATPTRVFGTDRAGNISVIDRGDGSLLGTLPLNGFPVRVANERTDRLYMCSTTGLVTCLREENAELPIYHRYPERRPILPLFGDQPMAESTDESGATPQENEQLEKGAEAVPENAP
jgi:outer membrane protein assembly factor BamB